MGAIRDMGTIWRYDSFPIARATDAWLTQPALTNRDDDTKPAPQTPDGT
jgi:hypothetical protein